MAMTIMNDASAAMTLGELNKNISELGKRLKNVSSGQRINGAGDGPSEYSISEKMRVRIRALDQDERNVLNGAALLRTAEGAIQQQIEIMKTIKEKVIDADNDTNTDLDRMTIQKEIDQGYQQIEDIAQETNYNGKRLLVGDNKIDEIYVWQVVPEPVTTPDSSLNIINGIYPRLDDKDGPFNVLSSYEEKGATADPLLGDKTSVNLVGGSSTNAKFTMSFENYTDYTKLDGVGFKSGSNYYVLTTDTSKNYTTTVSGTKYVANKININGLASVEAIVNKVATSGISGTTGNGTVFGKTITFTSNSTQNDVVRITGWEANPSTVTVESAAATGLFPSPLLVNNGTDGVPHSDTDPVTDLPVTTYDPDATPAKLIQDISSVPDGSGITVKDYNGRSAYIKFVDGNSALTQQADGSYTVGRNATVGSTNLYTIGSATGTNTRVYVNFRLSGGQMTLTSRTSDHRGTPYPFTVSDGVNRSGTWEYAKVDKFTGDVSKTTGGDPGTKASYSIDLTEYDTTDSDKLKAFTDALKGKAIALKYDYSSSPYIKYEFIDTATSPPGAISMDAVVQTQRTQGTNSTAVDLQVLRTKVAGGQTIAVAFIEMMKSRNSTYFSDASDTETGTKALKVTANHSGTEGKNEKIAITKGKVSQYSVNFADYFQQHSDINIPADLDGKGVRVYCATCPDQWFNFQFSTGAELDDTRPPSGSSGADLKTTTIDISDITDVDSLVKRFYETAAKAMETAKDGRRHTLDVAADFDNGTVTFYDTRRFDLRGHFSWVTEKGTAKIADGILDDVQKVKRGVYVKDLVIQHTDHASQNIHVRVPQTTLDHLFNFIEGPNGISEYNVMTTENREKLLGNVKGERRTGGYTDHEEKGALDRALDYLTSANTLVGAQIMRLEMTQANIVTARESTTNSESTIRDADMAKEMTGYTKANVLAQAAQSMLAQANQNSSGILSLLQ